jgi:hypothetical protein
LILNSSFESTSSWYSPWWLTVKTGAAATLNQDSTTSVDGVKSARINITKVTSTVSDIQFSHNVAFTIRPYTISFWAKASTPRAIQMIIQQRSSPYAVYFYRSINLTDTWQEYTYTFYPTVSQTNAVYRFNLSSATGNVWFDNIWFY